MIFNSHVNGHSLADEIRLAEEQLRVRRANLHQGLHTLDMSVRRRLTAPDALLWGVGTGFVLGEITKKRSSPSAHVDRPAAQSAENETEERPGVIRLALRYWAVARPIVTSVASILAPYLEAKAVVAATSEEVAGSMAETESLRRAGETYAAQHQAS